MTKEDKFVNYVSYIDSSVLCDFVDNWLENNSRKGYKVQRDRIKVAPTSVIMFANSNYNPRGICIGVGNYGSVFSNEEFVNFMYKNLPDDLKDQWKNDYISHVAYSIYSNIDEKTEELRNSYLSAIHEKIGLHSDSENLFLNRISMLESIGLKNTIIDDVKHKVEDIILQTQNREPDEN